MADTPPIVRVLLVGDRGTGKTTLIRSLVRGKFTADVSVRNAVQSIPPDVTLMPCVTEIHDTSLRAQSESEIATEIAVASVIIVVYAADDPESFKSVTESWLPLIKKHTASSKTPVPVLLNRNKVDLAPRPEPGEVPEEETALVKECWPLCDAGEVEAVVETSPKEDLHVAALFHAAVNAVLYPLAPIYDHDTRMLNGAAISALTRIFSLFDAGKDGLLDDSELNAFQTTCFAKSSPLADQELQNVKEVIRMNVEEGLAVNPNLNDGNEMVTLAGFCFLNQLFVERAKPETIWTVLTTHGYGNDLQLTTEYAAPALEVYPDASTELSELGTSFLSELFDRYAHPGPSAALPAASANAIPTARIKALFSITSGFPIAEMTNSERLEKGRFLNMWRFLAATDPQNTIRLLAELGLPAARPGASAADGIFVTRSRAIDWETQSTDRAVFSCYVVGDEKARAAFLDSISSQRGARHCTAAIGEVQLPEGLRWIVAKEIPDESAPRILAADTCANECDVVVIAFDVDDCEVSLNAAADLASDIVTPGPKTLVVGIGKSRPSDITVASKICRERGLPEPMCRQSVEVSAAALQVAQLASDVTHPDTNGNMLWYIGTAVAAVALVALVIRRRGTTAS